MIPQGSIGPVYFGQTVMTVGGVMLLVSQTYRSDPGGANQPRVSPIYSFTLESICTNETSYILRKRFPVLYIFLILLLLGQCTPCGAGNYSLFTPLAGYCLPCQAGSFNPRQSAQQCTSCPRGTYQELAQQPSCDSCYAGFFNNVTGYENSHYFMANNNCCTDLNPWPIAIRAPTVLTVLLRPQYPLILRFITIFDFFYSTCTACPDGEFCPIAISKPIDITSTIIKFT